MTQDEEVANLIAHILKHKDSMQLPTKFDILREQIEEHLKSVGNELSDKQLGLV